MVASASADDPCHVDANRLFETVVAEPQLVDAAGEAILEIETARQGAHLERQLAGGAGKLGEERATARLDRRRVGTLDRPLHVGQPPGVDLCGGYNRLSSGNQQ